MGTMRKGAPILGIAAACAVIAAAAGSAPPTRYVPVPEGKSYVLFLTNSNAISKFTSTESAPIPGTVYGSEERIVKSKWTTGYYELGMLSGYGLGSWWPFKSVDISVFLPFYVREYRLDSLLVDNETSFGSSMQRPSMRDAKLGMGLGDIHFGVMSLFYSDPVGGLWVSGALKASVPSGASAHERFVKILHGDSIGPGGGEGVARAGPALFALKVISRQRLYASVDYSLPLQEESFSVTAPVEYFDYYNKVLFSDSGRTFEEEITSGSIISGRIGVETTLNFYGIIPAIELGYRRYAAAKWTENGMKGTEATLSAPPGSTPEYISSAAWAIGSLPLKENTEVEFALFGTVRRKANDVIRAGLSYTSGTYGQSLGVRVTFSNLFLPSRDEDIIAVGGNVAVQEIEVSPVLEAPPAPSSRVALAVMLPVVSGAATGDEAAWIARQFRVQAKLSRNYRVMEERDMAQLANEPCATVESAARFGRALRQQALVIAKLDRAHAGYVLETKLVNVAEGTEYSTDLTAAPDFESLKKQIAEVFSRLTRPPSQ